MKGNFAPEACSRRRHGRGTVDEAGGHHPGFGVGMDDAGADTGLGGGPGGDSLVSPVDVFLGACAGQPHTGVTHPKHQVGQPAKAFNRAGIIRERRDLKEAGA